MNYSNSEKCDVMLLYGLCRSNWREAARRYSEQYPERRHPDHKTFKNLENNLREHGSFVINKRIPLPRNIHAADEGHTVVVLAYTEVNPTSSVRQIAAECNISKSSVQRILKRNHYKAYKFKRIHKLRPGDSERRLVFIAWVLVQYDHQPDLLRQIMWSDESRFHNNGLVSTQNCRYWSTEQPHWLREMNNQCVFSINVWCGILDGSLIGPHF